MCEGKLVAPLTFEGSCNRVVFEKWLGEKLLPQLKEPVRAFGELHGAKRKSWTDYDPRFNLKNKAFYQIFAPGDIIQFEPKGDTFKITFIKKTENYSCTLLNI